MGISHQKTFETKGGKKSPKQVCLQTSLALALFLPASALLWSVTGSSTVGISFLIFCSTFSAVTIRNCTYHNCSFQLNARTSSARFFIASSVVSLLKIQWKLLAWLIGIGTAQMHAAATFPLAASYTTSRHWIAFCAWIQVSRWSTQRPDSNVVAFLPWWPWRNKVTDFSFFKALKLPTPAAQQSVFCLADAAAKLRHQQGTTENLSTCFSQRCCVFAGATEVPFLVAGPATLLPMGMVPPCCSF